MNPVRIGLPGAMSRHSIRARLEQGWRQRRTPSQCRWSSFTHPSRATASAKLSAKTPADFV